MEPSQKLRIHSLWQMGMKLWPTMIHYDFHSDYMQNIPILGKELP